MNECMRTKLSDRSATLMLFAIGVIVLFMQLCVLHFQMFHSILVSSLWKQPGAFFNFYIPRFLCALGVGLLLYVTKYKIWLPIVATCISILYFIIGDYTFIWLTIGNILVPIVIWLTWYLLDNKHCLPLTLKEDDWMNEGFLVAIFLLSYLFNIIVFRSWGISLASFGFKLCVASFLTSIMCLCRHKIWHIIVLLLLTTWMIAEMLYYRANGFFMDASAITMVDNMDGWWASLKTLIYPTDLFLLLPTVLLTIWICIRPKVKRRNIAGFIICIATALILNFVSCFALQLWKYDHVLKHDTVEGSVVEYNPFFEDAPIMLGVDMQFYVRELSAAHAFLYNTIDFFRLQGSYKVELTDEDLQSISLLVNAESDTIPEPQTKLIICLIESFENWVLTPEIMPNLYSFIQTHDNILYTKVESQVGIGTSADGQMIVNTGLLPLQKGAACYRSCYNTYPSLSALYDKTCGIFPHPLSVWNQKQMCKAYHIDSNYVVSHADKVIFSNVVQKVDSFDYILAITSSTHNPFETICDSSNMELDGQMPSVMQRYIRSFNFFDEGLVVLLEAIDNHPLLRNATIVFTGDHKIFQEDMRADFCRYNEQNDSPYKVNEPYCPLIIYSPKIEHKTMVDKDNYYQMDIYPTVLSLIGCKDYYWRGFGVDILHTHTHTHTARMRPKIIYT